MLLGVLLGLYIKHGKHEANIFAARKSEFRTALRNKRLTVSLLHPLARMAQLKHRSSPEVLTREGDKTYMGSLDEPDA